MAVLSWMAGGRVLLVLGGGLLQIKRLPLGRSV